MCPSRRLCCYFQFMILSFTKWTSTAVNTADCFSSTWLLGHYTLCSLTLLESLFQAFMLVWGPPTSPPSILTTRLTTLNVPSLLMTPWLHISSVAHSWTLGSYLGVKWIYQTQQAEALSVTCNLFISVNSNPILWVIHNKTSFTWHLIPQENLLALPSEYIHHFSGFTCELSHFPYFFSTDN